MHRNSKSKSKTYQRFMDPNFAPSVQRNGRTYGKRGRTNPECVATELREAEERREDRYNRNSKGICYGCRTGRCLRFTMPSCHLLWKTPQGHPPCPVIRAQIVSFSTLARPPSSQLETCLWLLSPRAYVCERPSKHAHHQRLPDQEERQVSQQVTASKGHG